MEMQLLLYWNPFTKGLKIGDEFRFENSVPEAIRSLEDVACDSGRNVENDAIPCKSKTLIFFYSKRINYYLIFLNIPCSMNKE